MPGSFPEAASRWYLPLSARAASVEVQGSVGRLGDVTLPKVTFMSAIFISHSSHDNNMATEVRKLLENHGHRSVFLDFDPELGIPFGRDWEQELYAQLRSCQAVIILCSRHSMTSNWCFAEVTHAKALGKPIFPIKIGDCVINTVLTAHQVLDLTNKPDEAQQRLLRGLKKAGLDPSGAFDWDGRRPPYPGLMAFQEEDAAIFFGREPEIQRGLELMNRVRLFGGARMILMLGASGSGKSSLMRAGLVPRLRRDRERWLVIPPFRPGRQPLRELSVSLAKALREYGREHHWENIYDVLKVSDTDPVAGAEALIQVAEEIRIASDQNEATVVLVVDQIEELLSYDQGMRLGQFLPLLNAALKNVATPFLVLATLRSDFLAEFQLHPAARSFVFENFSLGLMPRERLFKVIKGPAQLASLRLDDDLTEALINDTETDHALPLLAFTLRELYEKCTDSRRLSLEDYREKLGGLGGSVAHAAESVYRAKALSPAEEIDLRRAFRALVRLNEQGQYVRQTASWHELPASTHDVLERFVQARLLVARGEQENRLLEVAHEALFRTWERLRLWLDEDREFLLWRQRLQLSLADWTQAEQDPSILLRGTPLAVARRWAEERPHDLRETERNFIAASDSAQKKEQVARERLRRRVLLISTAAAAVFLLAAAFTGRQWYKSWQALQLIQNKIGRLEVYGPADVTWKVYPRPNDQEDETIDQWNVLMATANEVAAGRAGDSPIEIKEGTYWLVLSRNDGGRPQVVPIRCRGYNDYQTPLRITTAQFPTQEQVLKDMRQVNGDENFGLKTIEFYINEVELSFPVKPFYVDAEIVKLEDFLAFCEQTGWKPVKTNDFYVNWYDAHAYCLWQRKRLMTAAEAVQMGRVKPDITLYFQKEDLANTPPIAANIKIVDFDLTEFIWDYQGDWRSNDIKGPLPFPTYKMKKNFDFEMGGDGWGVRFGPSKGYNPPNTRNEAFRFRCAYSQYDSGYVSGQK